MTRIYVDMCCLKRPFDDQSQPRVGLESQAVVRILEAYWIGLFRILRSPVLVFENSENPNQLRRMRVAEMLERFDVAPYAGEKVRRRSEAIGKSGVEGMDALHLAFAEEMQVDFFITCDDDPLETAPRLRLKTTVTDPITFVKEEMT